MAEYQLSAAAASDIEAILEHSYAQFGAFQAQRYYTELKAALELLAGNPAIGIACNKIREGYRRHPHASHVIYYRVDAERVLVIRVLHAAMLPERNL